MPTVLSIMMSDIVPLRERGTWQGLLNIIFALGAGSGAPLGNIPRSCLSGTSRNDRQIGGIFADSIGWRWWEISYLGTKFEIC